MADDDSFPQYGTCVGVGIAGKKNIAMKEILTTPELLCRLPCLSEKQLQWMDEWIEAEEKPEGKMVAGCLRKNCYTVDTKAANQNYVRAMTSLTYQFCNEKNYEKQAEIEDKALRTGETKFTICCGSNTLAATIGGTVAGVVVLVAIGVLIWLIVAKKLCFKSKTGGSASRVEVSTEKSTGVVLATASGQ